VEHLAKHGVIVLPGVRLRLVTHLDVDQAGIDRAIAAFRAFK
jgi:threonine aldolase